MEKTFVERDMTKMAIWRMRIACWIPNATNTHSQYVIFIAFSLQLWLHERALILCYTYSVCLFMVMQDTKVTLIGHRAGQQ